MDADPSASLDLVGGERPARLRLLDAATQAFAAKGFHGTTTRDIATLAGLSPAGVYVHYQSKEDLFFHLSLMGHRLVLDLVREAKSGAESPVDQLIAIMRAFTLWHAERHTRARVVNYELAALAPEHLEQIVELRRATEQEVHGVLLRAHQERLLTITEPRMTARAMLSLGVDIARWYHPNGSWTAAEVSQFYTRLALQMVGHTMSSTHQNRRVVEAR